MQMGGAFLVGEGYWSLGTLLIRELDSRVNVYSSLTLTLLEMWPWSGMSHHLSPHHLPLSHFKCGRDLGCLFTSLHSTSHSATLQEKCMPGWNPPCFPWGTRLWAGNPCRRWTTHKVEPTESSLDKTHRVEPTKSPPEASCPGLLCRGHSKAISSWNVALAAGISKWGSGGNDTFTSKRKDSHNLMR